VQLDFSVASVKIFVAVLPLSRLLQQTATDGEELFSNGVPVLKLMVGGQPGS